MKVLLAFFVFILFIMIGDVTCQIPNVYEFCNALLSDHSKPRANLTQCQCQGRPGKRGPEGRGGPPGPKGEVGEASTVTQELQAKVEEQEEKIKFLEQVLLNPESTLNFCSVGVKSGAISDAAMTSSSMYSSTFPPYKGRLDGGGVWIARGSGKKGDWVQIEFPVARSIAGVVTQGRPIYPQWVSSYKVTCANEETQIKWIEENGTAKIFQANSDSNTKVFNMLPEPVSCRFVRIYPQTWNVHISMRMDLLKGECRDFY